MPPLPRATCPVCGASVPVRVSGELRQHRGANGTDECLGSGLAPASDAIPTYARRAAADQEPAPSEIEAPAMPTARRTDVPLAAIRIDGGTQARVALDQATALEYMDLYIAGAELPDVVTYFDGRDYWLADGFHRYAGRERAHDATGGRVPPVINAEVRPGTQRDAILHAAGANAAHGLRRTNDDKRRAVMMLLEDEAWRQWSNRQIARHCGVSHPFVAVLRRELEDQGEQLELTDRRRRDAGDEAVTVTTPHIDTAAPLDLEDALRTLRGGHLQGDARTSLEQRVVEWVTRHHDQVDEIEPGMIVVTSYGTGPYIVQRVQDVDGVLSLSCCYLGGRARTYLNEVTRLEDGSWTRGGAKPTARRGTTDRLYLIRSPIDVSGLIDETPQETAAERRARWARGEAHPSMRPPELAAGLTPAPEEEDAFEAMACRICGCTNHDCSGCVERTGEPCWWVTMEDDEAGPLCSACEDIADQLEGLGAGDVVLVGDGHEEWQATVAGGGTMTIRLEWPDGMALCSRATGREVSPQPDAVPIRILAAGGKPGDDLLDEHRARHEDLAELANGERAPFDAYWTPLPHALACVRWLVEHAVHEAPLGDPRQVSSMTAVEPSVGGGAWVLAMHELLSLWTVDRVDVAGDVPGLQLDLRDREDFVAADWLEELPRGLRRHRWRMIIGNRPYSLDDCDNNQALYGWVERCLERADIVALLERETITGTAPRLPWWQAHKPAAVLKVVPRPKWEGPGARRTADFCDSTLIVWWRGHEGPAAWEQLDADAEVELAGRILARLEDAAAEGAA